MRAYSMDLRVRVLADCDAGMATAAVADKYSVSASWVRRLKQRRAATGETAPRPNGRRPRTWARIRPRCSPVSVRRRDPRTPTLLPARAGCRSRA